MTYKWISKSFLVAIPLLVFGILFSCKNPNQTEGSAVTVNFGVSQADGGNIVATVNDMPIANGSKVAQGSEVVFNLMIAGDYILEDWSGDGLEIDKDDPTVARCKAVSNLTVQANLTTTNDPALKLESLDVYHKNVDIANLNDVQIEVENTIKTLDVSDVFATFTYGAQTTPQEIRVKFDKKHLGEVETVVMLNVPPLKGKYKAWNQTIKIKRKEPSTVNDIPGKCEIEGIEVALLTYKYSGSNRYVLEDYIPCDNFKPDVSGLYTAKDAKTAYVDVRVKSTKKHHNGDYKVEITNRTTYIAPVELQRGKKNPEYIALQGNKLIALSKGLNILDIKVKSPDGTQEGTYSVALKYDGGPNQAKLEVNKRRMLPGVYCPAQRKPLAGEKPDFVWMMGVAGW